MAAAHSFRPISSPNKRKPAAKKKTTAAKKKAAARSASAGGSTAKPSVRKKVSKVSAKTTAAKAQTISSGQRRELIAEAAYLRAEAHGFATDAHNDWVIAEQEIDERLQSEGIVVMG